MQQKKISFTISVLKNLANISLPAQKKNKVIKKARLKERLLKKNSSLFFALRKERSYRLKKTNNGVIIKKRGKVAEWTNAPVLKTDVVNSYRGFESLPSRSFSFLSKSSITI